MSSDSGSTSFWDSPASTAEYLTRLESCLQALSPRDRREILDEIRSHIAERYGHLPERDAVAAVLGEFGDPEQCAAAYLAESGVTAGDAPPATRPSRAVLAAGGVALGAASVALLLFGLMNVGTPPDADSGWFRWRDLGLGRHGWLILFVVSSIAAAAAGLGAAAILRRARRTPGS